MTVWDEKSLFSYGKTDKSKLVFMSLFNKKLLFINVASTTKYPRFDNGRITRRGLMRVRDRTSYSRA